MMYPGGASETIDNIMCTIHHVRLMTASWAVVHASIRINGVTFGQARPGALFTGSSDIFSCVIHYPLMASAKDNKTFGGHHTLLIRATDDF
jgi:hypothetical protein